MPDMTASIEQQIADSDVVGVTVIAAPKFSVQWDSRKHLEFTVEEEGFFGIHFKHYIRAAVRMRVRKNYTFPVRHWETVAEALFRQRLSGGVGFYDANGREDGKWYDSYELTGKQYQQVMEIVKNGWFPTESAALPPRMRLAGSI